MPAASRIVFGITTRPARSTETSSAIDDPYATMAYQHMYGRMVMIWISDVNEMHRRRSVSFPTDSPSAGTRLPTQRPLEVVDRTSLSTSTFGVRQRRSCQQH